MNRPLAKNLTSDFDECENAIELSSNATLRGQYEFTWTENQEMLMIGCYYYGYVTTHILGILIKVIINLQIVVLYTTNIIFEILYSA